MRWDDERYVRLYTRDTTTWKLLSWQAKCLLPLLMRKLDRSGVAEVGDMPTEGIAALTDMPHDLVLAALQGPNGLLERGIFALRDGLLVMPKFMDAQEARMSDAQRQREHRARARDFARAGLPGYQRQPVVYFIQSENGGPIKIGYAADLGTRLVSLQVGYPEKLLVLATVPGGEEEERAMHARFAAHRSRGEWFLPSDEIMDFIRVVSRSVTGRDLSQPVTPSLAEPSLDDRVSLSGSDAGGITKLSDKDKAITRVRALPPRAGTQMEIPGAGKVKRAEPAQGALPDWLPAEVWEEWVAHRKASKHPLTPQAIKQQIRDLDKLRGQGHAPGEVIAQSISRGWRGLFAVDQGGGRRAKQGVSNVDPETKKRYEEAF